MIKQKNISDFNDIDIINWYNTYQLQFRPQFKWLESNNIKTSLCLKTNYRLLFNLVFKNKMIYTYEIDNKILGYLTYESRTNFIRMLLVNKDNVNQGIGTKLLNFVLNKYKYNNIYLEYVKKFNLYAFYKKFNFHKIKEGKFYITLCKFK